MTPLPIAAEPAAPPDWAGITFTVICPLCEYNLRGLVEPRCPECGYRFEWPEVLNPQHDDHPYLFEHHPERNASSFLQTTAGACLPARFWRSLHPRQRSRFNRILLYWALGGFALLLLSPSYPVSFGLIDVRLATENRARARREFERYPQRQVYVLRSYGSLEAYLDRHWPHKTMSAYFQQMYSRGELFRVFTLPLSIILPLAWPWLTVAALLIFQISMRRARIKSMHVIRCAVYSFDPAYWAVLMAAGLLLLQWFMTYNRFVLDAQLMLILCCVAVGCWRLWRAYSLYLRFDHPMATVLSAQVIVILSVLTLGFVLDPRLTYGFFQVVFRWIPV